MKFIREIVLLSFGIALAGCQPSSHQAPTSNAKKEAQSATNKSTKASVGKVAQGATDEQIIESAETCAHLAGEFGGDQSERDKEVTEEQDSLKCDQALGNLKALKARLPKDSPLLARVTEALSDLE